MQEHVIDVPLTGARSPGAKKAPVRGDSRQFSCIMFWDCLTSPGWRLTSVDTPGRVDAVIAGRNQENPFMTDQRRKVILDTDIGDDVDDALALGLICRSPELQLLGVTTVFGNVRARARQARTILAKAGPAFHAIPVAMGCGASLASRPKDNTAAYLHGQLPNQDCTCLPEAELAPIQGRHAVPFLIDTIMAGAGDIIPIAIGALTNIAVALVLEPRIAAKIPKMVVMAGEFRRSMAEWNIRCDPEAAHIVFRSNIPMDVTPYHIGDMVRLQETDIHALAVAATPLAENLAAAVAVWQHATGRVAPALFDPMAVATLLQPDLVTWKTGTVHVELAGQHTYGMTSFDEQTSGRHRVAWEVDADRARAYYLGRLGVAPRGESRDG